jgi:S-adenosylmethionine uptake transporter
MYHRGVFFLLLMMVVSCANDVIAKLIGQRLDPMEVIFFRFLFGCISLMPFIKSKTSVFKTSAPMANIIRGVMGVASFYLYTYSIVHLQIVEVVTVLWTIPLFILILSRFFLGEHVTKNRWIATVVGFSGLVFITSHEATFSYSLMYLAPVVSAFLFAAQDVMIKKMIVRENRVTMLLYFATVATALTAIPAMVVWQTPTLFELCLLAALGSFANLMQYFIFKAFEATDLSALAPYRYLEFLISALAGFMFFAELPGVNVIVGACILVPSTLYLAYSEQRTRRDQRRKKTDTPLSRHISSNVKRQ